MENTKSVDQRRQILEQFLADHFEELSQQGAVVPTWRRRVERRVGPYYLLVCRDGTGRQHSVYLGANNEFVDEVRRRLAELQRPRVDRRLLSKTQRVLRQHLKAARDVLNDELTKIGLYRKGAEIRGWSTWNGVGTATEPDATLNTAAPE